MNNKKIYDRTNTARKIRKTIAKGRVRMMRYNFRTFGNSFTHGIRNDKKGKNLVGRLKQNTGLQIILQDEEIRFFFCHYINIVYFIYINNSWLKKLLLYFFLFVSFFQYESEKKKKNEKNFLHWKQRKMDFVLKK